MRADGFGVAVKGHHVRPDLVYVGLLGVVVHLGGVAAGGAHVDLQTDHVSLFAQSRLIFVQDEEFQMDEAALNPEGFHGGKSGLADLLRQLLHQIVHGIALSVHDVHDGQGRDIAGLEQHLPLGVHDAVEGLDIAVDELLHDVYGVVLIADEPLDVLVGLQLVGVAGAHAAVRLDHHGIAHGVGKFQRVLQPLYQMIPGGGDTGLGVILLHAGLELDLIHLVQLGAGGDVELGAQRRVPHQPVFVVALQPVDLAVFVGEERNGLEHFVVIFQTGNLIIFVQTVTQLLQQIVIGAVADAQHPHTVIFQLPAEFPVGHGEIRGDEYEVLHVSHSLYL